MHNTNIEKYTTNKNKVLAEAFFKGYIDPYQIAEIVNAEINHLPYAPSEQLQHFGVKRVVMLKNCFDARTSKPIIRPSIQSLIKCKILSKLTMVCDSEHESILYLIMDNNIALRLQYYSQVISSPGQEFIKNLFLHFDQFKLNELTNQCKNEDTVTYRSEILDI